jgi:phosphoribosylanthranilate isomerase
MEEETIVVDSAPLIKICGITCLSDAVMCARLGVDWIGLNFHPKSARYIDPADAAHIVSELPSHIKAVGVFVNLPVSAVLEIARTAGLHAVQLHGDEPPVYARDLAELPYIKAFRLADVAGWKLVLDYLDECRSIGREPEAVLVDAYVADEPGGTGRLIADEIMAGRPPLPRLIVAGGLNPENVARRVMETRPWMVDVASGVESSPGRKDPDRVAEFVHNVRSVSAASNFTPGSFAVESSESG